MDFVPKGIIPPIVTPFDNAGNLDEAAFRRVIEFVIDGGVHGIFPMGTTGEFYALQEDEYRRILRTAVEAAAGRVPVYAGCNDITTRGVIRLIKIAEQEKADAVSVLTPMFIAQTQRELYQHFKSIADSTYLPVVMYNNKPKTNVTIEPETVAKLAEIENIVGVKDSTGDFTNTGEYLRLTRGNDNFSVLLGRDTLIYAGLCYGASGAIASCANVAPRVAADIYDKYISGDSAGALDAQFRLAPLRIACNMGTFPAVIKEGLNMQGIQVGVCLDPIQPISSTEKENLRRVLVDMGLV
ncbi:MAG: dihydrodipicolinate synthase family protein [Clostridiales bacterium]|jgi:4-hydroxy-tetrahydrodipicolinate synthase|nr:dihydrodipicolinate synthase family protein [Clostridiales bacterium]